MENNNTPPPFELKLEHQLEYQPEAEEFTIDASVKIIRQGSSPVQEAFFTSTVDNFIWEDEDCPEKVELYELLVDAGIIEFEAQFLLIDIMLYVSKQANMLDDDYKGVLTLTAQVTLPPEPVELNHAGSEQTRSEESIATSTKKTVEQRSRRLKPKHKIQKAIYKIGGDGVSLVLVKQVEVGFGTCKTK